MTLRQYKHWVSFQGEKGDNEKRPDYRGSVNVDGVEYWLSAWIRTAGDNRKRAGEKFMSLKLEAKEQQSAPPQSRKPQWIRTFRSSTKLA